MIKRMRRIHCVHFVGIGGLGYQVQGSDLRPNKQTKRLEGQGARCSSATLLRTSSAPTRSSFRVRSMRPTRKSRRLASA